MLTKSFLLKCFTHCTVTVMSLYSKGNCKQKNHVWTVQRRWWLYPGIRAAMCEEFCAFIVALRQLSEGSLNTVKQDDCTCCIFENQLLDQNIFYRDTKNCVRLFLFSFFLFKFLAVLPIF